MSKKCTIFIIYNYYDYIRFTISFVFTCVFLTKISHKKNYIYLQFPVSNCVKPLRTLSYPS